MIYDLSELGGSPKALGLAAPGTVITLVIIALTIAIEIMIFDGYRHLRSNTYEVSGSQETIPGQPEWRARAALRC